MKVLLIYPCFRPARGRSLFRFPPLGLGYVASALRDDGHEVTILDCTFMERRAAFEAADTAQADVVGIYGMFPYQQEVSAFARRLRGRAGLLVAGGPLPSSDPLPFMADFDITVSGEGERTMRRIVSAFERGHELASIPGVTLPGPAGNGHATPSPRPELEPDLDSIPFPARDLFPNADYIRYWEKASATPTASIITSRGCPFNCEFCSNAVFGRTYRERSAANIVNEVESALSLGYRRIHFADDVFTFRKERVLQVCDEVRRRKLRFSWECLCRVDLLDAESAASMKDAGCDRVFFGIESGSPETLALMGKRFTPAQARKAVETAAGAGLRTGAFFILCYPGDTSETVLLTLRFAGSLPLDYLSFTLPYPLPGTALRERMKHRVRRDWKPGGSLVTEHFLTYESDFSEAKMKLAILKGKTSFHMKRLLGDRGAPARRAFDSATDRVFRLMK